MQAYLLLSDGSKVRIVDWNADLHMLLVALRFGAYSLAIGQLWIES